METKIPISFKNEIATLYGFVDYKDALRNASSLILLVIQSKIKQEWQDTDPAHVINAFPDTVESLKVERRLLRQTLADRKPYPGKSPATKILFHETTNDINEWLQPFDAKLVDGTGSVYPFSHSRLTHNIYQDLNNYSFRLSALRDQETIQWLFAQGTAKHTLIARRLVEIQSR